MNRIKVEVFDNALSLGAVPYIGVHAIYDIINQYVVSSSVAPTTSTTAVTTLGATTLTLASATGFAAAQRVQLDTDDARETVTIRALTGSSASVVCQRLHAGTYPVEVESALTLVRGILSDLITVEQRFRAALPILGLKKVDEAEWFGGKGETAIGPAIEQAKTILRLQLVRACGLGAIYAQYLAEMGAPQSVEVY